MTARSAALTTSPSKLSRVNAIFFESISAALPCGRHYFSPHKMAAKNHRLSWHCRFNFLFVWKLLQKYEKGHHFCAHAQRWSPWRRKNVEKGHLAPSNLTFLLIATDRNGFRRMKQEGLQIYRTLPQCFLVFAYGLVYDLSKLSDDFTPFSTLKDHN